jgi:uncharacterized membrane protein YbhN (UPF0104 family)
LRPLRRGYLVATVTDRSANASEGWVEEQLAKPHRLAALVAAAAILSLGALAGVASTVGYARIWHQFLHWHWIWLPVALAGELCAYLGYTLAYREVARAERGPELELPKAAALVTTGFGVFVQGGGFALDRAALQRAGLSQREARARVLGLGALEYAVLAPATAVAALIIILKRERIDGSLTWPWVIAVPAGAAIALLALCWKDAFRGEGWRRHVRDALKALELLLVLVRKRVTAALAFAGIALYWIGDIFCLWATLHVFYAHTPPVAQLLVGYSTGYALTRRTLPLGGAGVVEALLPFALGWVAIGRAPAVLAVAAYRTINLWLPLVPALAGIPSLRRLEQARPHRRRTARA